MYTNYRSSNHINILSQTTKPPVHTRANILASTGGFSFFRKWENDTVTHWQRTVYLITPSSFPTFTKALIALSSCSFVCAAESCTRMRASFFGTTG